MSEGATFVLPTATVAFLEAERLAHEGLALTAEQGILLETFEQLEVLVTERIRIQTEVTDGALYPC